MFFERLLELKLISITAINAFRNIHGAVQLYNFYNSEYVFSDVSCRSLVQNMVF